MEEEKKEESQNPMHMGKAAKKEITIKLKKDTLWKAGAFLFAALFLISILGGFGDISFKKGASPTAPSGPTAPTGDVKVEIESNDPVLGEKDAEISIVEFSDFQCPFCQRVADGALAEFKNSDYFKNGEVNLVYKQFPLNSIHPYAQNAGEASLCAQDQEKFWEYHDELFANQDALDDLSLKAHAQTLGLDLDQFNGCLDGDKKKAEVENETKQAGDAGARGTPYFVVINNKSGKTSVVSGAVPWANFETAIKSVK